MVTVRNDIEMVVAPASPDGTKVKDVNLKQEAKPARRKSYRCIMTVGVVTLVLLSLAVGSVFFFEDALNGIPSETGGDGSPSSTTRPEEKTAEPSGPAFADPFDRTPGQSEIALDPVDSDEIDIDETPSTTTTARTTTLAATTTTEVQSIEEGSGDDEDSDYQYGGSGSGSGDDDMW